MAIVTTAVTIAVAIRVYFRCNLVLSRVGSPDHIRKIYESNRIFYLFDSFFTNRVSKIIDESNIEDYSIRFDSFGAVDVA